MAMRIPAVTTILLVLLSAAAAEEVDPFAPLGPVPEGARVTLSLDRTEYLVGELVLVHFRVENTGAEPFRIRTGGDYRFSTRAQSYAVTAVREDGLAAADPDPTGFHTGGMISTTELAPGESWYESLPLHRYRRIDTAGTWTVTARHDLGWEATPERPIPVATAMIRFRMPTAEEARAVVAATAALPKEPRRFCGEKDEPWADFTCLALPIYLPALADLVRGGARAPLDAIADIATPEATRLLVDLLDHEDAELALLAARTLNLRLPDPERRGELEERSPFRDPVREQSQERLAATWLPELAPRVRSFLRKRLKAGDDESVAIAGFMLQCLGEKEDVPAFVAAFDVAAARSAKLDPKEDWWPRPYGPVVELVRAAEVLVDRGVAAPAAPETPGEEILFLAALSRRPGWRPEGWDEALARIVDDEIPWMRYWALDATPEPAPARVRARLPDRIADPWPVVAAAACRLAGRTGDPSTAEAVRALAAATADPDLLREASNALYEMSVRVEQLKTLAARLDDPDVAAEALDALAGLVDGDFTSWGVWTFDPEEGKRLKRRWTEFLDAHAAAIEKGRRFSVGGPELTPDLFPPGYRFTFRDGTRWPPPR